MDIFRCFFFNLLNVSQQLYVNMIITYKTFDMVFENLNKKKHF